jgi:cell division protein FtsW (lipid II flippase)
VQAVATGLMVALAFSGNFLPGDFGKNRWIPLACVVGAATICALPLLFSGSGPKRWVNLGPVRLYVAPVVLPLALAVSGHLFQRKSKDGIAALTTVGLVLALQPDFSQVLAFSVGFLLILFNSPTAIPVRLISAGVLAAMCVAAYLQPDPLKPVPYVEGVFELAFRHSIVSGVVVLGCAVAFLGLLARGLRTGNPGFLGIPAYYAMLFGCSVAGLTPAPLIGFGAGPLIGFGILVGGVTILSQPRPPETPLASN